MGMASKYVWMNGALVEFERATVHFLTPALHYGAGVFEGIRCYDAEGGPAVFRLSDHMERLISSARVFGFLSLAYTAAAHGTHPRSAEWLEPVGEAPPSSLRKTGTD